MRRRKSRRRRIRGIRLSPHTNETNNYRPPTTSPASKQSRRLLQHPPPLLALANTRIQKILDTNWSADRFPDVVKEAINSNDDIQLQKIISLAVNERIEELMEREDFTPDIIRHVSISIIEYMIKRNRRRISCIRGLGSIEICQNELCAAEFGGRILYDYDPYELECRKCGQRQYASEDESSWETDSNEE
jgi:hypothetical protein